ncbi:MAG: ATPase, T2SS/T4P/T4SS family [Candidatus Coatesbacteria bacterium]
MALKRLGSLLVEEALITEEQLAEALTTQKTTGDQLGEALVKLGHISEESLYRFLAIQHGLEFIELNGTELSAALIKVMPAAVAWKYRAVPVSQDDRSITLATCQPDELSLFYLPKELKLPPEIKPRIVVAPASEVLALLNAHFPKVAARQEGSIQSAEGAAKIAAAAAAATTAGPDQTQVDLLAGVEQELLNPDDIDLEILQEQKEEADEGEQFDEGPIIKLCDYIIADAVRQRASDVHITPYEKDIVLRYRIDGSLIKFPSPPARIRRHLATRFKILSKTMNIIERRLPQDGRIHVNVGAKTVDLRISTMPTRWGENIVMRVMDQSAGIPKLEDLGLEGDQLEHFIKAISQPYGMVFVTGPTASGKTTTLFSALQHVNTPSKNILTVEDPVEFRLPHIIQIMVDQNAGRTFGSVLRAFLRHDPNVMLVGETRDAETASIANKAALTGHLVLTSVHTNDACSTIMRLVDLGIEHVYVGSSVLAVTSQRLLRKICDKCKEKIAVPAEELARIGLKPEDVEGNEFFKGRGCDNCHKTGYRGRLGVFEVMPITTSIREVIFAKGNLAQLKTASREAGFKTIRDAAIIKWRKGLTTLEEVLGETYE